MALTPAEYDRWYQTPRGRWIGRLEYGAVRGLLKPHPDESLLDVGCGTGYFTRCFAHDQAAAVVGVDPDPAALEFARFHAANRETYLLASGESLPFPSRSFDLAISITAMCFVHDQVAFLREMARVTRRCFAVGLLNRHSLLWRRMGRAAGQGGYQGAHWHTKQEIVRLCANAGISPVFIGTALQFPSANAVARMIEGILPIWWPWGGFLVLLAGPVPS